MAEQDVKSGVGRAKIFVVTYKNDAVRLFRSTEERPEIAPDTLISSFATSIFVKEYLTLQAARARITILNGKNIVARQKINLNCVDAGYFVFYKEAKYVALIANQKDITTI
jgi:hypothetical protein